MSETMASSFCMDTDIKRPNDELDDRKEMFKRVAEQ